MESSASIHAFFSDFFGRRSQYEFRANEWKFSCTLVALISLDNDDYVTRAERAMKAFEATGGPQVFPKVLRYMTLLANLLSPKTFVISPVTGRHEYNKVA